MNNFSRRRFLQISAAATAVGGVAFSTSPRTSWQGRAFGGDVSVTLRGDTARAKAVLGAIQSRITALEAVFSLYQPDSELSRLNTHGRLYAISKDLRAVLLHAHRIYIASAGLFDPTIQALWHYRAHGRATHITKPDFSQVTWAKGLDCHGHQLSFNGIAQGYASDQVEKLLHSYGFNHVLVNMGEYKAAKGKWRIGIEDAQGQIKHHIALSRGAVATTTRDAMRLASGHSHVINPKQEGEPLWQSLSVIGKTATMADGWSTAFSLMSENDIHAIDHARFGITQIYAQKDAEPLRRIL